MSFDFKDLPYAQFEQLGMSKRDVIKMPPDELANMLNGHRTNLIPLTINLGEGMKPFQTDAKLSLIRNPDNTVSLGIHPILAKPTNTIDATPEQWEKMLKGEPIIKDSKSYNGSLEPHIHQLDKETNEILTTRINAIQLPKAIKDTVLSPDQKEQLKRGESIEIGSKNPKEAATVRLDLNEPKGYTVLSREQTNEIKIDAPKESIGRSIKM